MNALFAGLASSLFLAPVLAPFLALAPLARADWSNLGGNERTNGLVAAAGPTSAELAWQRTNLTALIAYAPAIEGDRVYFIRQTVAQNPVVGPGDSILHCVSRTDGSTLWSFDCPFSSGDWTTVLYGVKGGRVYVGRGGNGSSVSAPVHCLDAATGKVLWVSSDEVATGSYDGVVFLEDGDPVFTSHLSIRRIDAETGQTVWSSTRTCSVSGSCGPARDGDAIYLDEVGSGGQVISRFSATTGQRLYSSPVMPGFLNQNSPFCAPGGLVFYLRTQNDPTVDRFYALRDTGSGFEILWSQPARYEFNARHAITPDGGVTMISPQGRLQIRDQLTGALRSFSPSTVLAASGFTSSMTVVDSAGTIYHSNGGGGNPGDIRVFSPTLQLQWSLLGIPGLNQGGPAIAADGSMYVTNTTSIRRYFVAPTCVAADLDCNGVVDALDLAALLAAWGTCSGSCGADLNGDQQVDALDLASLLAAWG